jgi:hypothetical protein
MPNQSHSIKSFAAKHIDEAQKYLVSRHYDRTILTCLKILIKLCSNDEQLINESNVLEILTRLSPLCTENEELLLIQDHCLSMIIQSLYENRKVNDALQVLPSYYSSKYLELSSFQMKATLLQMYIHEEMFEKAEELLEYLKKNNSDKKDMQKEEQLIELEHILKEIKNLQKEKELDQSEYHVNEEIRELQQQTAAAFERQYLSSIPTAAETVASRQTLPINNLTSSKRKLSSSFDKGIKNISNRKKKLSSLYETCISYPVQLLTHKLPDYTRSLFRFLYNEKEIILVVFGVMICSFYMLYDKKSWLTEDLKEILKMASWSQTPNH